MGQPKTFKKMSDEEEELPFPVDEPKKESEDFVQCQSCSRGRDGMSKHEVSFHRVGKPPWKPPKPIPFE